jgi:hypothetical protein
MFSDMKIIGLVVLGTLCLQGTMAHASDPQAPASQYQLDKSHASLLLREITWAFPSTRRAYAALPTCIDIVMGPQLLDAAKYGS